MSSTDTRSEPVVVRVPTPLRRFTAGQGQVEVQGATAGAALADLIERHPEIRSRLLTEDGALRTFVNVFVGERDLRVTGGLDTPLEAGAVLSIVPAVAGGFR